MHAHDDDDDDDDSYILVYTPQILMCFREHFSILLSLFYSKYITCTRCAALYEFVSDLSILIHPVSLFL